MHDLGSSRVRITEKWDPIFDEFSLQKIFSIKYLNETVKIYKDRTRRFIKLSQYIHIIIIKVLRKFNVKDSKKRFLPILHGV
jgi:hypothetical protein